MTRNRDVSIKPATDKTRRGPVRRKPAPLALEARFMFDGAAVTTATTATSTPDPTHTDTTLTDATRTVTPSTTDLSVERSVASTSEQAAPREIAFVDTSVPNWQALVAAVRPGVEVILLDPT